MSSGVLLGCLVFLWEERRCAGLHLTGLGVNTSSYPPSAGPQDCNADFESLFATVFLIPRGSEFSCYSATKRNVAITWKLTPREIALQSLFQDFNF